MVWRRLLLSRILTKNVNGRVVAKKQKRNYQYQFGGHRIGTDETAAMTGSKINMCKQGLSFFRIITNGNLDAGLSAVGG